MPKGLERRYGHGHLHFLTFSCYRRLPLLRAARTRDLFLKTLDEVRGHFQFVIVGYVVMPEHVHLLIGEPETGTPSKVLQVLKQRVSKAVRRRSRRRVPKSQLPLWDEAERPGPRNFWQHRFYDFNEWSERKKNEKLHYMHMNPVKRGLVAEPKLWAWSSYRFYRYDEPGLCTPNPPRWWEPRLRTTRSSHP